MPDLTITIGHHRWRLEFVAGLPHYGDCDHVTTVGKAIRIRASLRGLVRLETLLHELLHASGGGWWDAEEHKRMDALASDIARALWRLGVRFQDEAQETA